MVREFVKLGAEVTALKSILISESLNGRATPNWQADLAALRKSPEYLGVLEVNEPLIAGIEQAMTDNDLIELLARTPPSGPPN
jgi:hypothetical protein